MKRKPNPGCLFCKKYKRARYSVIVVSGKLVDQTLTCKNHRSKLEGVKVRRMA